MPTRRRKFSVQNDIVAKEKRLQSGRGSSLQQTSQRSAGPNVESKSMINGKKRNSEMFDISPRVSNKPSPTGTVSSRMEILNESPCISSTLLSKKIKTQNKNVTASSSNIDLFNLLNIASDTTSVSKEIICANANDYIDEELKKKTMRLNRDTARTYPHPHRIQVRSPKRKIILQEVTQIEDIISHTTQSVGTETIQWASLITEPRLDPEPSKPTEENIKKETESFESIEEEVRHSNDSLTEMCRICHGGESLCPELGNLVSACACRGTVGRVHVKCLERWLTESGKSKCELCGIEYATRRIHRYGVIRALVIWILSQNTKQIMVDTLGILLMSPLAVLAAWLSGRTLAGLMTQEAHSAPWPLASTFVLACMTLVCYYCWIVSAASRHALGWWIWYRSQYEVKLNLQNED